MRNIEELKSLREARGLMILVKASVAQASETLEKAHCRNLGTDNRMKEMVHMDFLGKEHIGGGVTEFPRENFRLHPHRAKVDAQLESEGFTTRIDFLISRPTATVHYVTKKLIESGLSVAVPTPAGTHFLENWAIFTSIDGEPKIQKAGPGTLSGQAAELVNRAG